MLDPMKIIVPSETCKAILDKYPHLEGTFVPYQHIPVPPQSVPSAHEPGRE